MAKSSMELQDRIANCALDHLATLTKKGKPDPTREWTVYSAIVAERESEFWVASCATGTKCTSNRSMGYVLPDCHAEVLARRGLMRNLWLEVLQHKSKGRLRSISSTKSLLVPVDTKFSLRSDIRLHLYISDSPCGDASIYPVPSLETLSTHEVLGDSPQSKRKKTSSESPCEDTAICPFPKKLLAPDRSTDLLRPKRRKTLQHTGAKLIVSARTGFAVDDLEFGKKPLDGAPIAREKKQVLGALRTKSGRSNILPHQRSSSLSCSDKILQWCVLGVQGGLLMQWIAEPVFLTSIVIGLDPRISFEPSEKQVQLVALERAILHRLHLAWASAMSPVPWKRIEPSVYVAGRPYANGKAAMAVRETAASKCKIPEDATTSCKKSSPCGVCLNWQQSEPDKVELIVGARGTLQGRKAKSGTDFQRLASRLSRQSLVALFQQCLHVDMQKHNLRSGLQRSLQPTTYQTLKTHFAQSEWQSIKFRILDKDSPLAGWLRNKTEGDFSLGEQVMPLKDGKKEGIENA